MKKVAYVPSAQHEKSLIGYTSSVTPLGYSDDVEEIAERTRKNILDYLEILASAEILRAEDALRMILDRASNYMSHDAFNQINKRIGALMNVDDWKNYEELPNAEAFNALIMFLFQNPQFKPPSIFLRPDGSFDASWRPEVRKLSSLTFRGPNEVSWMIFIPWDDDDEGTEEATGRCAPDKVMHRLACYGAAEWMEDK